MSTKTKDWIGNQTSTYSTLGASNHSDKDRVDNDYYATEPKAVECLLEVMQFAPNIWEPACGGGHMSKVLLDHGYNVLSTDLIDRGYGTGNIDFFDCTEKWEGDIVTNPPYKHAMKFALHALDLIEDHARLALFLKVQFLEGKERKSLFSEHPPKYIYVSSSRLKCAPNGHFETVKSSAVAYAWFIWEKGFTGDTVVRWIN